MANIQASISATPGITNYLIITLYKTTAPTSEIDRIVKPAPHTSPYNFEFTDLDAGEYIVNIYESVDGSTLGILKIDFWVQARTTQSLITVGYFKVDGVDANDPNDGDSQYLNPALDGVDIQLLFLEGVGPLKEDVKWQQVSGGLGLLGGDKFIHNQEWTYVYSAVVDATSSPSPTVPFTSILVKTSNHSLTTDELGKIVVLSNAGVIDSTLPNIATVTDEKGFLFQCESPSGMVEAYGSDVIRFRGQDVSYIYFGIGESAKLIKGGGKWYVIDAQGSWDKIGERVFVDAIGDNMMVSRGDEISCDGTIYRRIYDWVTNLPPSQQVSFLTWNGSDTKKKFWGVDTATKKLKVPNMQGMSIRGLKSIGGTVQSPSFGTDSDRTDNIPGGFQASMVGPHDHSVSFGGNNFNRLLMANGVSTVDSPDNTPGEPNLSQSQPMSDGGGTETRVDNVGLIPAIRI